MRSAKLGLREQKKRLTRATIADAALRLSLERGLDNVTIDDIADTAFISPRTFSNYFSCKEEAVVAAAGDWTAVLDEMADRPMDEAPLQALCHLILDTLDQRTAEEQHRYVQQLELVRDNDALLPFQMAQFARLEQMLMETVAARTGTDVEHDMYPRLVATAAVSAIKSALGVWLEQGAPDGRLQDLVRDGFEEIGSGLPAPDRRSGPPPMQAG